MTSINRDGVERTPSSDRRPKPLALALLDVAWGSGAFALIVTREYAGSGAVAD